MKTRWIVLFVAIAAVAYPRGSSAQSSNDPGSSAQAAQFSGVAASDSETARRSELTLAVLTARERASGRSFSPALRASLSDKLSRVELSSLEAFYNAGGTGDIDALVRGPVGPRALGDAAADLVFTPVTPCRIINTTVQGGPITGNTQRSFFVNGNTAGTFETQGGTAGGCGIPDNATAVEMNFVAVGPAGPGDFRAFPWNATPTVPLASVINYSNVSGLNIANGIAQPVCNAATTTCTFDLIVQADVAASHLVVDVVGYYRAANVATVTEGTGTVALPDTTCRLVTSCTVSNPNSVARDALAIGVGNFRVDHTVGTHDEGTIRLSTSATPTCANFPLLAGDSKYDVNSTHPTGCCMEGVAAASKTFSVPANSSLTIRMYAAMVLGAGGTDEVARGTLDCFLP